MAQDQLRKPQPTRGTRGGAFAYCGSHLSHAEPQFTPVYRSRHPRTPQGATKPFTAENSPDHLNYYPCSMFTNVRLIQLSFGTGYTAARRCSVLSTSWWILTLYLRTRNWTTSSGTLSTPPTG